jgi:hypothetical protein
MLSSQEVIQRYLRNAKQLVGEPDSIDNAGGTFSPPTQKDSQYLETLIRDNGSINKQVLYFALFLVLIVFVAAIITIPKDGSLKMLLGVVGVGTGSEIGLLAWILRIWAEYNRFAIIMVLCQRLDPEELMRVMLTLNLAFNQESKKSRGGPTTAPQSI